MIDTETMFDAATYREVREPLLEARNLPSWCYTTEEFYKREVERVFLKTWSFAGRADEIPNAGDYLTVDMPGGSVVVLRGRDGVVRAFANTCRHRGAQLLSEEKGNCRAITCPYHSWVYGLDGRLIGTPNMEQTSFDKGAFGLEPLRLDSWAGFLFVNFSDSGPTLLEQLGDLPEQLGPYNHDGMVCVKKVDYHVACNWKFLLENALESYHTGTVHRTTLGDQQAIDLETRGDWEAIFLPGDESVSVLPGEKAPLPRIKGIHGRPAEGTYFTCVYPSTQFACATDSMWWLRIYPKGPHRTHINFGFCFPKESAALPDFWDKAKPYFKRWQAGLEEDNVISVAQHAGALSVRHRQGPFSYRERAVHRIANWLLDRVLDPPADSGRRAAARNRAGSISARPRGD